MGTRAPTKIDQRTVDAKRLRALKAGVTDIEVQAEILARQAASLILAGEKLAAAQAPGADVDPDLIVRVTNATARALSELNSSQPNKRYWTSAAKKVARAEMLAALDLMTEGELLALREQVGGGAPPPAPAPVYVPVPLIEKEQAQRQRILDERARTQGEGRASSHRDSKKKKDSDEGHGVDDFDPVAELVWVLR